MNIKTYAAPPVSLITKLELFRGKYTLFNTVFHAMEIEDRQWVGVFGDGDNGSYEWFYCTPSRVAHSDCGYGSPMAALRDGLNINIEP